MISLEARHALADHNQAGSSKQTKTAGSRCKLVTGDTNQHHVTGLGGQCHKQLQVEFLIGQTNLFGIGSYSVLL